MQINQILNYPKKVIVYGGRYCPFHRGHFAVYNLLLQQFPNDSVFIASSNLTGDDSHPFTFEQKKLIATTMFQIDESKFVYTKNPYQCQEITKNFDKNKDILIIVIGEKDNNRLKSKHFETYADDKELLPFSKKTYILTIPMQENGISASKIRSYFKVVSDINKKKQMFVKIYGKFNRAVFNLLNKVLQS